MHADVSIINLVKKSTTIKKIRVLLSDPDATDSSSDEGSNEKNTKIYEIVSDQKKMASLEPKVESNKKNVKYRKGWSGKSRKRFPGVRISKSGKFAAEIRDPVKKKTIWLGTFNTAEEAYDAYLAKKRELNASEGIQWEAIHCKESERDGLSNEQSPSLMPETEALNSPANTGSEFFNDSSSSSINREIMKIETLEYNGGCVMGMLIPVPGRQKDNSGPKFFLPIVDNHGFLLGEFSKLDDLSIPDVEDDNITY